MADNKEVIQRLIDDGEIDADSVSVEALSKHSEPTAPNAPTEDPNPKAANNNPAAPAPAAAPTGEVGNVSIDGQEYSIEELRNIVSERQKDDELTKKNTQESERLATAHKELEQKLSVLRENAGADEVLKGTIDQLESVLRKQIENDEFISQQKTKAQYDEDVRTMNTLKADAEKRYGITLPPVGSQEFKKYVDLSMTGNPLDLAIAVLHPDKVGLKTPAETPDPLDKGGKLPSDNVNVKFDRELQVAAEKAGIPIENLRKWVKR